MTAENHFWDAFGFQKVERKWKMTGCLLLGPPDEKVTNARETPTGLREKRIPTSFIDGTYYANPKDFFFPFSNNIHCTAYGEYCSAYVDRGLLKVTVIFRIRDVYFRYYYNFRF